jgi:hypothetical protein
MTMPADQKETLRTPEVHSAEVKIWGTSRVVNIISPDRYRTINIDSPVPSALEWFMKTLDRLKAAPDCPKTITEAAHRLEHEMDEAFRRRQVDARWVWGYIKNKMRDLDLWERSQPKKST